MTAFFRGFISGGRPASSTGGPTSLIGGGLAADGSEGPPQQHPRSRTPVRGSQYMRMRQRGGDGGGDSSIEALHKSEPRVLDLLMR